MTVRHILARKGNAVTTAAPTAPIGEVVQVLAEKKIGGVVITGAGGRIVGIVSERDVVRALATGGAGIVNDPVSTIMTRSVVTCSPDETVNDIMRRMTEGKFRHVPVVEDDRLVGIVSIGDVVKHRLGELESEANAMRDYIVMA
jgi:CBS domain-containing protein